MNQACSSNQFLAKSTLLASLPQNPDTTRAIVVETGVVINISQMNQTQINTNIDNGTWVYYEQALPRRLFLTNPMWIITSFDSKSRVACVSIYAPSGVRVLSVVLPQLIAQF